MVRMFRFVFKVSVKKIMRLISMQVSLSRHIMVPGRIKSYRVILDRVNVVLNWQTSGKKHEGPRTDVGLSWPKHGCARANLGLRRPDDSLLTRHPRGNYAKTCARYIRYCSIQTCVILRQEFVTQPVKTKSSGRLWPIFARAQPCAGQGRPKSAR